jgi:integrase
METALLRVAAVVVGERLPRPYCRGSHRGKKIHRRWSFADVTDRGEAGEGDSREPDSSGRDRATVAATSSATWRRRSASLKRVRIYDLRHSYCSMAVRAWRLDEVKAYARHADIAMTMRYVHFMPANDAADRLSAVISAATMHPDMHRTPALTQN